MIEVESNVHLPMRLTKADIEEDFQRENLKMLNSYYLSFVKIYTDQ